MKNVFMVQCELHRKINCGIIVEIAWIPKQYAVLNKHIDILIGNEWVSGWKVTKVYNVEILFEDLNILSNQHNKMRLVSDI